jgi:hypothetical protein
MNHPSHGVIAVLALAAAGCLAEEDTELSAVASEIVLHTRTAGGYGGRPFEPANGDPDNKIIRIEVRSGAEIDGLRVTYESGLVEQWGGTGGTWKEPFEIEWNEELIGMAGRHGARIDSIRFVTSRGRLSPQYGGRGGTDDFEISIQNDPRYRVLGLRGRAQNRIDAIGFSYWREDLP